MLKGNLSTRPFYNEGLVNLLLVVAAAAGVAMTVFSANRLMSLSSERGVIAEERDNATRLAATTTEAADREKKSIDRGTFMMLGGQTQEANSLIDERTFSWTIFFGQIEKTLPLDARLIAVAPRVEKGEFRISMTANAKTLEDLSVFLNALKGTGSFFDLLTEGQQFNPDDTTYSATITGSYVEPQAQKPAAPAPKAGKGKSEPAAQSGGQR